MTKVIVISGKQGSGKTTTANSLKEWCKQNNWKYYSIKFADTIYEIHDKALSCISGYGFEVPKKDGKLLQLLGTEWGRNTYGEDVWVRITKAKVDILTRLDYPTPKLIVIDDCRFLNELYAFPDAIRVRLDADRDVRKARCDSWRDNEDHPSETQFDNVDLEKTFDRIFYTGPQNCTPDMITSSLEKEFLLVDK